MSASVTIIARMLLFFCYCDCLIQSYCAMGSGYFSLQLAMAFGRIEASLREGFFLRYENEEKVERQRKRRRVMRNRFIRQ